MTNAPIRLDAFGDVLTLGEIAQVLRCSESTIKRRLSARTFPIPQLDGIDKKTRFAKTAVVRYLESSGRVRTRRG